MMAPFCAAAGGGGKATKLAVRGAGLAQVGSMEGTKYGASGIRSISIRFGLQEVPDGGLFIGAQLLWLGRR